MMYITEWSSASSLFLHDYTHGLEEVALTLLCRISRYPMICCRGRLLEMKAKQEAQLPTAIVYRRTSELCVADLED
jgi:hypothetical protein